MEHRDQRIDHDSPSLEAESVSGSTTRIGRRLTAALFAVTLASSSVALAGGTGTFPHLYDIGTAGDFYPASDVAVYADGDVAKHVFVADRGAQYQILRHAGTGVTNTITASVALPPIAKYTPIGLAVNDMRGSIGFGKVFVSQGYYNFGGMLWTFDVNLAPLDWYVLTGVKLPNDVALDNEGNVYVSDSNTGKIYVYDAVLFNAASGAILPSRIIKSTGASCISVDHNKRVHATSGNLYQTFDADGAPKPTVALPFNMTVCALNPCADGYLTRLVSGAYDFVRYNWNWCSTTGAIDLFAGAGWLARPEGMEFQKFTYGINNGQVAPYWQPQHTDERMFVTTITGAQKGYVRVFGQSTDSVPVPAGFRTWWRFEETQDSDLMVSTDYLDALGPDAAVPVGVPRTVEGMVRSAFDTKAGTVYATVADSSEFDFGTGSLSIEGWVRSEQTIGTVTLMDKRVGIGAGWSVYLHNGYVGFQTNVGGVGLYQNFTSPMNGCGGKTAVGAWKHFAIVLDRTVSVNTLTIYLDGVAVGTTPSLAGSIDNDGPLYLGRNNLAAGGTALKGALDEVTLYDQPLSAAQVLGIFNAGTAGKHVYASSSIGG